MVFVIKVKYGEVLRRFTIDNKASQEDLSFSNFENKIRKLFDIPAEKQFRVTYTDGDNDLITMGDGQDLMDALIMQSLNPLRVHATLIEPKAISFTAPPASALEKLPEASDEAANKAFERVLNGLNDDPLKNRPYDPLPQLNDVVEQIVKIVKKTAQVQKAVKGVEVKTGDTVEQIVKAITTKVENVVKRVQVKPRSVDEAGSGTVEAKKAETSKAGSPLPSSAEAVPAFVKSESNAAGEPKSVSTVFHNGVQCDVCGACPIAGTRFKSIRKHDYDLCTNCFKEADDQADYTRIERPLYRPRHLHSVPHNAGSGRMRCPALDSNYHPGRHVASMSGPYSSRPIGRSYQCQLVQSPIGVYGGKLDSRFVEDVTIMDGTEMAPGTRFTKIWRLRNSGKVPWASQTKLVHVGGDELGSVLIVPVKLHPYGLLPDQEVDAAVDLIAPEKPGRYVSHWRLASPSGPKFGHRVWVVIQVVSKENSTSAGNEAVDMDADNGSQNEATEKTPLLSDAISPNSREASVKASHDAFVVSHDESRASLNEATEQPEGKITYPEVDMTSSYIDILGPFSGIKVSEADRVMEMRGENSVAAAEVKEEAPTEDVVQEEVPAVENSELGGGFSMVEMPSNESNEGNSLPTTQKEEIEISPNVTQDEKVQVDQGGVEEDLNSPERLSLKLEAMGFVDRKLNVELLVKNKLDLRRTLDDLFAAAEWDPILEELEEMGFYDTEMNRRLMFKNNGSVKLVVKELVQLYKESNDQGKAKGLVVN